MDFWYYFKYIIDSVLNLMTTRIVIGGFTFTFLSVFIGSALLGLIYGAVGRLFR